jgi:hypothetical protein
MGLGKTPRDVLVRLLYGISCGCQLNATNSSVYKWTIALDGGEWDAIVEAPKAGGKENDSRKQKFPHVGELENEDFAMKEMND